MSIDPHDTEQFPLEDWMRDRTHYGKSGVYFLWDDGELVYIGRSNSIRNRIKRHVNNKVFDSVSYYETWNATKEEADLIKEHWPKYNSKHEPVMNREGRQ